MKPILAATALTFLGCIACQRGPASTLTVSPTEPTQATLTSFSNQLVPAQEPTQPVGATPSAVAQASSCDISSTTVPLSPLSEESWFAAANFDFRPYAVEADVETLVFKNSRYTVTFCRADRTWSVETATAGLEETGAVDNPEAYAETVLAHETYAAKVRLSDDFSEVTFELQRPMGEAITQSLYDQDLLQRQGFGAELGYPFISRTVTHDGALWWAINFEQGEGWSGIATIVQYRPGSNALQVFQPEALDSARIMDMVVTGSGENLALWLGTQYSGEGTPDIPAKGLVAYLPSTGEVIPYTPANSPLVGAIPSYLLMVDNQLWAATANGVCEIPLQTPGEFADWDCWRFTAEAELPTGGVPLRRSATAEEPLTILSGDTVEVLWASYTDRTSPNTQQPGQKRYEVRYEQGFTTTLNQGAEVWADYSLCEGEPLCGLFWAGRDWHWNGSQFARSHDEVELNYIGGGPQGLGDNAWTEPAPDWQAMRGSFDLLSLTATETRLRYYSGWVDAAELTPYVTVVPTQWSRAAEPNPLFAVERTLTEAASRENQ